MVVMVLSKLRTFTVFSVTSMTVPSAPYLGIVIQSPTFSMSLAESCTPLTKPMMLSLNTSIRMAAEAPSPASSERGDLPSSSATTTMIPMVHSDTCNVWSRPFSGRSRMDSFSL